MRWLYSKAMRNENNCSRVAMLGLVQKIDSELLPITSLSLLSRTHS